MAGSRWQVAAGTSQEVGGRYGKLAGKSNKPLLLWSTESNIVSENPCRSIIVRVLSISLPAAIVLPGKRKQTVASHSYKAMRGVPEAVAHPDVCGVLGRCHAVCTRPLRTQTYVAIKRSKVVLDASSLFFSFPTLSM